MADGASFAADVVTGGLAALRAPHVISASLRTMIDAPVGTVNAPRNPDRALRVAMRSLALLARVPGAYWRNTCLYQSVAECAVRRARGWPARVVIGVAQDNADVIAHSWVEIVGTPSTPIAMTSLRPARPASSE